MSKAAEVEALMQSLRNRFVVVEGPDGAGKTTVISMLADVMKTAGLDVLQVREPGSTPAGEAIRELLQHKRLDGGAELTPRAEVLLFSAARAQLLEEVIGPALAEGKTVLSSRFWPSTLAYQGGGQGVDVELIARATSVAVPEALYGDFIFVLDCPTNLALSRVAAKHASGGAVGSNEVRDDEAIPDKFEEREFDFHRRVRMAYLGACFSHPEICRLVDASGPPHDTFEDLLRVIKIALAARAAAGVAMQSPQGQSAAAFDDWSD